MTIIFLEPRTAVWFIKTNNWLIQQLHFPGHSTHTSASDARHGLHFRRPRRVVRHADIVVHERLPHRILSSNLNFRSSSTCSDAPNVGTRLRTLPLQSGTIHEFKKQVFWMVRQGAPCVQLSHLSTQEIGPYYFLNLGITGRCFIEINWEIGPYYFLNLGIAGRCFIEINGIVKGTNDSHICPIYVYNP